MERFDFNAFMAERPVDIFGGKLEELSVSEEFLDLCEKVRQAFYNDWENRERSRMTLEIQKKAIIGYEKEKKKMGWVIS